MTATYAGASHTVGTFNGTTPSYLVNDNDTVAAGVPFTQSDYDQRSRVALVGLTVATSLVGGDGTAIVGQTVQFNGIDYDVRRAAHVEGQHRAAGPGRPGRSPR